MNDQVSVSWQGLQQLIDLTREQYLNVSEASGFLCTGQLTNTAAFSGVLGMFKGAYSSALDTVTASLGEALTGTQQLTTLLGDVRDDLRRTDAGISELHTRINATVECQAYTPGQGVEVPQVNDTVVNLNDHVDVPWAMTGPPNPSWLDEGNLNSPIGLADATMSLAENASHTGQGLDHQEDIDDYVDRND